jgi:hypothetical protein
MSAQLTPLGNATRRSSCQRLFLSGFPICEYRSCQSGVEETSQFIQGCLLEPTQLVEPPKDLKVEINRSDGDFQRRRSKKNSAVRTVYDLANQGHNLLADNEMVCLQLDDAATKKF